ncbi:MAG: type II toxin-antitoxin system Phd/YefM family antitoxin [Christensenellales bacterium]|jgi:antitoxin Phd
MLLDTREMISVTEANQNFSRATRIADQRGKAVILKGNRPKYLLLHIEADPRLLLSDDELIGISATRIFKNHRAAFEELAK